MGKAINLFRRRTLILGLVALLLIFCRPAVLAAPGDVDPSFNPGLGIKIKSGDTLPVRTICALQDGTFILGGFFTNYDGVTRPKLAKILPDGALDLSFIPDPIFAATNTEVWSIAEQPDGKLIVGGFNIKPLCVRLNRDGSVDPTFSANINARTFGFAVAVRADGSIGFINDFSVDILRADGARAFSLRPPSPPFGLFERFRQTSEGTAYLAAGNSAFSLGGLYGLPSDLTFTQFTSAYDIDMQSNGQVIIVGTLNPPRNAQRFSPNGVVDTSFNPSFSGNIYTLALQPDDKILVGGDFTSVKGVARKCLARLNANGSLDTTFGPSVMVNSTVYSIVIIPGGKALIAGAFTNVGGLFRSGIARIFLDPPAPPNVVTPPASLKILSRQPARFAVAASGSIPLRFQWKKDGEPIINATNSVLLIQKADESFAGAYTVEVINDLGRAESNPATLAISPAASGEQSIQSDFPAGLGANSQIHTVLRLNTGKWLVGGYFQAFDNVLGSGLARLNPDGTIDESINYLLPSGSICRGLTRLSSGAILATIDYTSTDSGLGGPSVLRLTSEGAISGSCLPAGYRQYARFAGELPDGRIIVGGEFRNAGNTSVFRLKSDLSIEVGLTDSIESVQGGAILPGGHIVVVSRTSLVLLTSDGVTDLSLPITGGSFYEPSVVTIQPDGKILVGGIFTSIAGIARTNLVRLNSDFTVDSSFDAQMDNITPSSIVRSITVQPDGKILLGGKFAKAGGKGAVALARLLPNGAFDPSFHVDIDFGAPSTNVVVFHTSIADDGYLNIAGLFSRVNGYTRNSLARIFVLPPPLSLQINLLSDLNGIAAQLKYPVEPNFDFTVEQSSSVSGAWTPLPNSPHNSGSVTNPIPFNAGFYRLRKTKR